MTELYNVEIRKHQAVYGISYRTCGSNRAYGLLIGVTIL